MHNHCERTLIVIRAVSTELAAAKSPQVQNTTSAEWVDPIVLQLQASAQSAVDVATTNDLEDQEELFVPPTEQELMAE